jgi:hypothetical protein
VRSSTINIYTRIPYSFSFPTAECFQWSMRRLQHRLYHHTSAQHLESACPMHPNCHTLAQVALADGNKASQCKGIWVVSEKDQNNHNPFMFHLTNWLWHAVT